jgi:hypothetical protein
VFNIQRERGADEDARAEAEAEGKTTVETTRSSMILDTMHRRFMLGDALTIDQAISDVEGPNVAKWVYEELLA